MQDSVKAQMPEHRAQMKTGRMLYKSVFCVLWSVLFLITPVVFAQEPALHLQDLIDDALKINPEILVFESRESAAKYRIPQAKSLPEPMFMFGYMNEGVRDLYTFGEEMAADSQWMFSISQMFPFPGKLPLKGKMALSEAEVQKALLDSARLKTIARIKELYYELFFIYKNIDLIKEKSSLFSRIEDAAVARYAAGMAPQQEVLMAQTEKYMLLEKEEMLRQKIQSLEAMLNAAAGRDINSLLGRPVEPSPVLYSNDINSLLKMAHEHSPEIKAKEKMVAEAEAKVQMAKREYYPDFTVTASYFAKSAFFEDMWSITTSINIPLFYKTKQAPAVLEAEASMSEAKNELEATKLMIAAAIKEDYSMLRTSEKLMELYKSGLIPKAYQDFESAIAGYITGKVEAITVINRLKSFIDLEIMYWRQFIDREKAIARLETITGRGISN